MDKHVTDTTGGPISCFTVYACGIAYALPATDAECIFRIGEITQVPLGPDEVAGLTNLRGRVLTVISLQRSIMGQPHAISPGAYAIGLHVEDEDFALVVDRVGDVVTILPEQRVQMLPHFTPLRARVTEGVYRVGDDLLSMLNVRALIPGSGAEVSNGAAH